MNVKFFFFPFQKLIFIKFDCSNKRELFGTAQMQNNFKKFKGQNDGDLRVFCVVSLKNAQRYQS